MKLNISYLHLDSTPSIEEKVKEKADHLKKYFDGDMEVNWACSIESFRHKSEVNVHAGNFNFHATAEDDNLYKTFDEVVHKLEKQLQKKNEQLKDKIHRNSKKPL